MSQENLELIRNPLRVRERSSRTLDQRLSLQPRSPFLTEAAHRHRAAVRVTCAALLPREEGPVSASPSSENAEAHSAVLHPWGGAAYSVKNELASERINRLV